MSWEKNRLKKVQEIIMVTKFFTLIFVSMAIINYIEPHAIWGQFDNNIFIVLIILNIIFLLAIIYFDRTFLKNNQKIPKHSLILSIGFFLLVTFIINMKEQADTLIMILYILPLLTISITHGLFYALSFAGLISINVLFFNYDFLNGQDVFDIYIIFIGILFLTAWLAGSFTDLERKARDDLINLNKALEESEKKYNILFNGTSDVAVLCQVEENFKVKILKANHYFINSFNLKSNEIHGKYLNEILSQDIINNWTQKAFEALKGGKEIRFECFHLDKYYDTKFIPIVNNNKTTHLIITASDITHKKEMENYRIELEKMESIGLLAGGIAHDFNNLLMVAIGNISLVKEKLNISDQKDNYIFELLEKAENSLDKSKSLTQQLLTFAKGDSPVKKAISIKDLLNEACSLVLAGSNVNCELITEDDLRPIKADEGQIYQVINNIMINAKQAMPEGGTIKIEAENITINNDENSLPLDSGDYVKISIKDDGIGIPREYLDKIFDPYFTTKNEGSGLGLASCHSIILKHGGYITVDSKPGIGTTFNIYLKAASFEELEKNAKTQTDSLDLNGNASILIMDDEAMIRETLYETFSRYGYDVACAKDGEEALDIARNRDQTFDIAFLDLTIPGGKGGKETIKELKDINSEVKAYIMSGYSESHVMSNYYDYNFEGVIKKPFRISEVKEILDTEQKSEQEKEKEIKN
ncbi:hybrid sensor histidine kinase/response regulator [Natranaerofaba carboxydovora]|uniref:hybrid sensor histidine kinase/response regulator n=1 Tax=Natranaerofaba carboxydovora TaxID=2742683 RepID=UPI001F145897|nr:ATP-binding protein [Natranaerofaba carboxydovora]UMZ74327.1 Sensor kinase CckA [Natranaerofaba carboxydovora]